MKRLFTEGDLVATLESRLDGRRGQQGRLADDLGISQGGLSNVLTGGKSVSGDLAERLGFKKVIRFEPIEP